MNVETNFSRDADAFDDSVDFEAARKKRRTIIIAAIIGVFILAVLASRFLGGENAPAVQAETAREAPRVTVIVPGSSMVDSTISATGSLAARRDMPVGAVGEGGMVTREWRVHTGAFTRGHVHARMLY